MSNLIKTLWQEPCAPDAPGPLRRDWVLVVAPILVAGVEGFFSQNVVWPLLSTLLTAAQALTLPWRRTHPLRMVVVAFGITALVQIFAFVRGVEWSGFIAGIFLLILPYALLRWGSGRQAFIGLGVIAVSFATGFSLETKPWNEVIGGSLFLLFPAALGAAVRYQDSAQRRAKGQVRIRERERLARELHDTVAHHVSAIAIQAQAGQAVATLHPEAPLEALKVIEEAASRTLIEMRSIVRALRDDGHAERTPAASLADIERLAADDTYPLRIAVTLSGELDDLDTTLASTLFRLTQESVTNAVRHAEGAQSVTVHVTGEPEQVYLSIKDDGNYVEQRHPAGLGLRGMVERVALLGGSMSAGPGKLRGWTVEATLPKQGAAS